MAGPLDSSRTEDEFVDLLEGRVFVRRWTPEGGGTLPPIVLLHDSLGCVELWRDFPAALAARTHRVVFAYDRLGHGRSSAREELPSAEFVTEEAHELLPALLDRLGLRRVSLLGHSVGGGMSILFAADGRSDCDCECVITVAAQAYVQQRTLEMIRSEKEQFTDPERFAKLERLHGDKARWVLDAWTESWFDPDFARYTLDPFLGRVECPVLVIHGDQDEYGSVEFPRRIAAGVKGPSQLAILEGCGHVPHRERQGEVLELVSGFLVD